MIISASRRTDIPTWYSDWFFRRIREGYVLVRNPMNAHQVSRISLDPAVVDGIVFWTKNPTPMLGRLDELREYMYYFQFTVNGYGPDAERNVPDKDRVIVPAFQRLSDTIGPERVIWRYDPIFLSDVYTPEYHLRRFEALAKSLAPYTRRCVISFLDIYRNTRRNIQTLALRPFPPAEQDALAGRLAAVARGCGLQMESCSEEIDLEKHGICHGRCVDGQLFEKLLGCPLDVGKDKNQRQACGCVESVDVGAYNTCRNGCLYCYANYNAGAVENNAASHDPSSPLLLGRLGPEDKVTQRKMESLRVSQMRLEL